MKVLKVGIASYAAMKARTIAIARGQLKLKPDDPKIWFSSTESMGRVLSEKNVHLLATIRESGAKSLTELARLTGREKSNLSRTLKTMERYGIVQLERAHGKVVPSFLYQGFSVELPVKAESPQGHARRVVTAHSMNASARRRRGGAKVHSL
jgi:predicted transcriptional regulator